MSPKEKLTAREKTIAILREHGWVNDPTATRSAGYGGKRVSDPDTFVRNAASRIGQWRISLDYSTSDSWSSFYNDIVKKAEVWWVGLDGKKDHPFHEAKPSWAGVVSGLFLRKPSRYDGTNLSLYEALRFNDGSIEPTTRQAIELFVKNPDLAIWVAGEHAYAQKVAAAAEREQDEEHRRERAKPLRIKVSPEEWRETTRRLSIAAQKVANADGMSDLVALVTELNEVAELVTLYTEWD